MYKLSNGDKYALKAFKLILKKISQDEKLSSRKLLAYSVLIAVIFLGVVLSTSSVPIDTLLHKVRATSAEFNAVPSISFAPSVPSVQPDLSNSSNSSTSLDLGEGSQRYIADVLRVVDGDTLILLMNGKEIKVRLIGINTPETVDPRRKVECFGKEASLKANELLGTKTNPKKVYFEYDASQGTLDKYGRSIGYVFLEDGLFFNKYMIEQGYAYEYTYSKPYKYQKEFKEVERIARLEGRGLWAANACDKKL